MAQTRNLRDSSTRIEQLLEELRATTDPATSAKVEDLVHLLVDVYGAGLRRIMETAFAEPNGAELLGRLAADELVASLLVLHDLHPHDTEARVLQALDKVSPYLGSHAGGVELLGIDDSGIVHLRLQGSCQGCPSSSVTVKLAIERAIEEAAPEITGIEVEGVTPPRTGTVISLDSLRRNGDAGTNGNGSAHAAAGAWITVDGLVGLAPGTLIATDVAGAAVVVCSSGGDLYAYGNRCPSCGFVWQEGSLDGKMLVCAGCGERYDVRQAGRSVRGQSLHLDPLPLLAEDGTVRIAVPGA
ncbi:MAG: NifU family protein, partial [Chloroflexia bacterium]|nr:NifU family protein [Chloroflexia bacterium]